MGVACRVFVSVKVNSNCSCEIVDTNNNTTEVLWVKININKQKNIYTGSLYRPPNHSTENLEQLKMSLETIKEITRNHRTNAIILEGDFNTNDIDWKNCRSSIKAKVPTLNKLLEILMSINIREKIRDKAAHCAIRAQSNKKSPRSHSASRKRIGIHQKLISSLQYNLPYQLHDQNCCRQLEVLQILINGLLEKHMPH